MRIFIETPAWCGTWKSSWCFLSLKCVGVLIRKNTLSIQKSNNSHTHTKLGVL